MLAEVESVNGGAGVFEVAIVGIEYCLVRLHQRPYFDPDTSFILLVQILDMYNISGNFVENLSF